MTTEYLGLRALCQYSGLSRRTIGKILAHDEDPLPFYRPGGGKILVRVRDFEAWMERRRERRETLWERLRRPQAGARGRR